jgi:glycine/D-amino acid oxidase-like deaminating enzyme
MESISKAQPDYLVVGQGLAGSLIALNLMQRGKTVVVIDDGHKHAASKVAAGLINPITGRRHVLTWRFLECWNFLLNNYPKWEEILGTTVFHKKPILRFLKNVDEKTVFEQKLKAGDFDGIELCYRSQPDGIPGCRVNEQCYLLSQAGYVDQALFVQSVRKYLQSCESLVEASWSASDFNRDAGWVQWKQFKASRIIFTQGFQNDANPFFRDLPFRHSKGEILELSGPKLDGLPVLNRGKWLLPISPGRYRAGATYDLKNINQRVTDEGISEITKGLEALLDWEFEVTGSQAGVRPALHDFKPVVGKHPWYPELVIFNGLGSKGSLQAPLLAKELVDHLEDGTPLHPQADIERFRKYL